jgi:hypothetical protein
MAEVKLKSKTHIGSGNYEWVYDCFCGIPAPLKEIKFTASGNQSQADQLALLECEDACSKSKNSSDKNI